MEVEIAIVVQQFRVQLVDKVGRLLYSSILHGFPYQYSVVKRAQIHRGFHTGFCLELFRCFFESLCGAEKDRILIAMEFYYHAIRCLTLAPKNLNKRKWRKTPIVTWKFLIKWPLMIFTLSFTCNQIVHYQFVDVVLFEGKRFQPGLPLLSRNSIVFIANAHFYSEIVIALCTIFYFAM